MKSLFSDHVQASQFSSFPLPRRNAGSGFTLVEVMVSCAMICITCTTFMFVFSELNQMAMIARLYTGAAAIAQSQIDLIGMDGPFQPQNGLVPPELTPQSPGASVNVAVYQDPVSGAQVSGTMTTTITPANTTYTTSSVTETMYLYRANVTVTYQYRNRTYSVSFCTLRTSDA